MKLIIFATLTLCLAVNADVIGKIRDKIDGVRDKVKEALDFSHDWNALKVSWWADPRWGFDKLPRTLAENNGDFELKDDQCANGGGKFVGQRYWHKGDPALILLFDKNGIIAGVQTASLKANFTPAAKMINKYYIDDGDLWTLTAYFVDPSEICSEGRTTEQLISQGTGTGLWLQQGPNPVTDSVKIPMTEDEMKRTNWVYGKCFPTMGKHYWYNVTKDMACDDFVPNCILYNHGKLTAFCFAKNNLDYSTPMRYKYGYDSPAPKNTQLHLFLDTPDFFFKEPSYKVVSTMHFYFIESPRAASLCI